jgi:NADH:ubiquinone oxidoreductase subunit F (NADH-binding)
MRPGDSSTDPGTAPGDIAPVLELLHRAQEEQGYLREEDIARVARTAETSPSELYGAVSAYARFRLRLAPATDEVCTGPACLMAGAQEVRAELKAKETHCLGLCDQPVAVLTPDGAQVLRGGALDLPGTLAPQSHTTDSAFFGGDDPLEAVRTALTLAPDQVIAEVTASGLQGRGGAGFPTGQKWEMVRRAPGEPKYVVCNLDESEPGTFKDRMIVDHQAERVVAGIVIAAHAVGAERAVIYIRFEYGAQRTLLIDAIERFRATGINEGRPEIVIRRAAGLYVCGEETALLNSLEGRRPIPRDRPPYPTDRGLFGRPTLIQNAETLAAVPAIISRGVGWHGGRGSPKLYCVSGDVPKPGVFECPLGVSAGDLIGYAGASAETVKAFTLGGLSGGLLPAAALGIRLDFENPRLFGGALGSGGVIVLGHGRCVVRFALEGMRFFAGESCGKCFPCRIGTTRLRERLELVANLRDTDSTEMREIVDMLLTGSACGLGPAAGIMARHLLEHFGDEVEAHHRGECPAGECGVA